ncbi:MAG TPA: 1,4-alpha-glucan branching protein GlgB [Polyangia bacterium]|nr:1,4-alpha-glucan branching protein GlgB [Polyangia bacterium]
MNGSGRGDAADDAALVFGDADFHLLAEGTHAKLYDKLGAHAAWQNGKAGTRFAVWAPNAETVEVIGDWSGWQGGGVRLRAARDTGVWQGFAEGIVPGQKYKYRIQSRHGGYVVNKADPFAFAAEMPPATASVVAALDYTWGDGAWMQARRARNALVAPMSTYEVHLGSWMRDPEHPSRLLGYRELAPRLVEHVQRTGFTHVELMPIMEHPFYGSWGYQVTSFFAPSARYGTPQDFMFLIDTLHQAQIGVILDWTPAHFPEDEHGLVYFDGTHLYEHADPREGHHAEWGSAIFNYGRNEVRSFLVSNATFWLDRYHVDGLRVDAVASMLYRDYARKDGEWVANQFGGRENLEAIDFMRTFNLAVYRQHPDVQTIAEESTAWPMVSRPTYVGGLGFGLKWDMGWMHDTLAYFAVDPVHRRYHHNKLTFRGLYAFSENFVLPLSHDEVVHGKGSLLGKMAGDTWQKFANLRALYAYMWAQPGKKLLFMGGEFGQWREWSHERSLDWHLLRESPLHGQLQLLVGELNRLYRSEPSLHERDADPGGFEWIAADDVENSVYAFLRRGRDDEAPILAIFNNTPLPRFNYRLGVPVDGRWVEILNTDAAAFGGSNHGNVGAVSANPVPSHGRAFSVNLTLPPLGALFLKPVVDNPR